MNPFLLIRKLLEKLGWWPNPTLKKIQEIDANIQKRQDQLKKQQDNLKDLKKQIEDTQEEILLKEKERNSQAGELRKITEQEIAVLFKNFDSYSGKRDLIIRNISSIQTLIAKFNQYKIALESDMDSDELELLIIDLSDNIKEIQQQDRLINALDNTNYTPKNINLSNDVNAKLAQLHGETVTAAPEQAAQPVMPRYEEPQKPVMPTNEEVADLEAKLKGLHKDLETAQESKTETANEAQPEQLKE